MTRNHHVAHILGSHRVNDMTGEVVRAKWCVGSVVGHHKIGLGSLDQLAQGDAEALRGESSGAVQ